MDVEGPHDRADRILVRVNDDDGNDECEQGLDQNHDMFKSGVHVPHRVNYYACSQEIVDLADEDPAARESHSLHVDLLCPVHVFL